ncbi:hypothetical protein Pst134EA_005217 [Puccinia striiformis f. sp. tritici]|uniref:hypothetical protein n=1 Tax=Puccinia striiformis f. sp. tritici TaxID=168172 RepID=UPI0020081F85|nr:hypothetical protein Pst134EA_005217 [Puccinia striiformis f. sp. tritici]KAH9462403.1 hypothetical protein Pst134EB_006297 [Puccinia striiformis f. sp. tritici]KAH9471317.1 hypothetical protein Pst134EA_005217 [Puccinia striiformis f. sp. tritici]
MALFNLRSSTILVATVFLVLLNSSSQVGARTLERRDLPETQTKAFCDGKPRGDIPPVVEHDCNVAFTKFGFEGKDKVARGDSSLITSVSETCRVSAQSHICSSSGREA